MRENEASMANNKMIIAENLPKVETISCPIFKKHETQKGLKNSHLDAS